MEKEVDIVALGELLIDFTEAGKRKDNRKYRESGKRYVRNIGIKHGKTFQ